MPSVLTQTVHSFAPWEGDVYSEATAIMHSRRNFNDTIERNSSDKAPSSSPGALEPGVDRTLSGEVLRNKGEPDRTTRAVSSSENFEAEIEKRRESSSGSRCCVRDTSDGFGCNTTDDKQLVSVRSRSPSAVSVDLFDLQSDVEQRWREKSLAEIVAVSPFKEDDFVQARAASPVRRASDNKPSSLQQGETFGPPAPVRYPSCPSIVGTTYPAETLGKFSQTAEAPESRTDTSPEHAGAEKQSEEYYGEATRGLSPNPRGRQCPLQVADTSLDPGNFREDAHHQVANGNGAQESDQKPRPKELDRTPGIHCTNVSLKRTRTPQSHEVEQPRKSRRLETPEELTGQGEVEFKPTDKYQPQFPACIEYVDLDSFPDPRLKKGRTAHEVKQEEAEPNQPGKTVEESSFAGINAAENSEHLEQTSCTKRTQTDRDRRRRANIDLLRRFMSRQSSETPRRVEAQRSSPPATRSASLSRPGTLFPNKPSETPTPTPGQGGSTGNQSPQAHSLSNTTAPTPIPSTAQSQGSLMYRQMSDIPLWPGAPTTSSDQNQRGEEHHDKRTSQPESAQGQDQQESAKSPAPGDDYPRDKRGRRLPTGRPKGGGGFRQWVKQMREKEESPEKEQPQRRTRQGKVR